MDEEGLGWSGVDADRPNMVGGLSVLLAHDQWHGLALLQDGGHIVHRGIAVGLVVIGLEGTGAMAVRRASSWPSRLSCCAVASTLRSRSRVSSVALRA